MGFITANQAAHKWGISQRRVQILCAENRIEGVFKLGENIKINIGYKNKYYIHWAFRMFSVLILCGFQRLKHPE